MMTQTYKFDMGVLTIKKNSDSRLFQFVGDRVYEEIIWDTNMDEGTQLSDIDKIFDMELFDEMTTDVPSVSVLADECILSYELAVGKKMRTICIALHKKIYDDESESITTLRDELMVCRNKIAQLEQMANENAKKISMLERYVGRLVVKSDDPRIWERNPDDYINMCSLIDFSDAESIKNFYSLSSTISRWLEPHRKYTNIKEDMTTFINLAGKNINTIFQQYGTNIVSELINVMALDRIDVDTWKHITACLKKNGADLNGEKFIITQLNKIAERKPMMVSHVLSELL